MDSEQTPTVRKILSFYDPIDYSRNEVIRNLAIAIAIEKAYWEFVGEDTDAFMSPNGLIDISAYIGQKWAIETLIGDQKILSVALEQLDHPEGVVEVQSHEDPDLGDALSTIRDIFNDLGIDDRW